MQLMVQKSDGSQEVYLHTKIMGTIAAALGDAGYEELEFSDKLAEAVTIYLSRHNESSCVSVDEIYAMIQAVLTDYQDAAVALHDHRIERQIRRSRIEVVKYEKPSGSMDSIDPEEQLQNIAIHSSQPWNKSVIVKDLVTERDVSPDLARAIAGAVEEKALRLQSRSLSASLVQELVNDQWLAMRQAQQALAEQKNVIVEQEEMVAAAC